LVISSISQEYTGSPDVSDERVGRSDRDTGKQDLDSEYFEIGIHY